MRDRCAGSRSSDPRSAARTCCAPRRATTRDVALRRRQLRGQRLRPAPRLSKNARSRTSRSSRASTTSRAWPRRCTDLQHLLIADDAVEQLLERRRRTARCRRRTCTIRDSTARCTRKFSSARSSLMKVSDPPALGAEQRRLRDEDVPALDERRHLAVEERQQQRADVRAVDVRVGHDDDAVVAQLLDVEVLGADAAAERRDHRLDFVGAEHAVEPRALDVQDLALDRQDRLEAAIAALLGRAAGRLAFDDVDLGLRGIALLAVGQLAGQRAAVERALAAHQVAGLAGRLARARRVDRLLTRRAWRPPGSPRGTPPACR